MPDWHAEKLCKRRAQRQRASAAQPDAKDLIVLGCMCRQCDAGYKQGSRGEPSRHELGPEMWRHKSNNASSFRPARPESAHQRVIVVHAQAPFLPQHVANAVLQSSVRNQPSKATHDPTPVRRILNEDPGV